MRHLCGVREKVSKYYSDRLLFAYSAPRVFFVKDTHTPSESQATLIQKTKEAIADGKIVGDGHTIFNPDFYAPHFSEAELRKAKLIHTHKSDTSSHKATIFGKDGNPIEKLEGIYNLYFLYWLCGALGIDSNNDFNGRGSQAQELAQRIRSHINK